ncbi:hypothetical protein [Corallococcus sp. AB030]|uniref:hypothetical protein n=1 Tax=Corallococcus sp. AB030 TaxID=2316716 RepID=UPI0011E5F7FA|nr:hypothetical protein [Corallococcus sp. AB030]
MNKKTSLVAKLKPSTDIFIGLLFGPKIAAVIKGTTTLGSSIFDYVLETRTRKAMLFVESFMDSGYPNETATPLLEAELAKAPNETKDAVVAAIKTLEEAISDAVIPSLGLLTREYTRASRPKDRFFVGVLRLLRDLSSAEYEALVGLVATVGGRWSSAEQSDRLHVQKLMRDDIAILTLDKPAEAEWQPEYDALFQGLESAGFVSVATGFSSIRQAGDVVRGMWFIKREPWMRLATILPRPTPPASM